MKHPLHPATARALRHIVFTVLPRALCFILPLALTGCADGDLGQPTVAVDSTEADLEVLSIAVSDAARRNRPPELRRVRIYALPDGGRIGCGDWDAPDPYGGFGGYAPFYVRYAGGTVSRVHLDDLTGYGPARTGCLSAEARLSVASG